MYKKLIMFAGVACVAVAVFFTSNVNKNTTDMNLKNVVSVNTANAECRGSSWHSSGKCLALSQVCVSDVFSNSCSF